MRVARGFDTEPIQRALDRIPPRIRELVVDADFLCGVDPVYVGLHEGAQPEPEHGYGTTEPIRFDRLAHMVYPHRQPRRPLADRSPTVVIPMALDVVYGAERAETVVAHELGHWLDCVTGFGCWLPSGGTIPTYSTLAVNWWEGYAEAFEAWLYPELFPEAEPLRDSSVYAHFEGLAR